MNQSLAVNRSSVHSVHMSGVDFKARARPERRDKYFANFMGYTRPVKM